MNRSRELIKDVVIFLSLILPYNAESQENSDKPNLIVYPLNDEIKLDGQLDEPVWHKADSIATLTMELSAERNEGKLQEGRFVQNLYSSKVRLNISPDFQINTYIQYDNESRSIVTNTRLRWTFHPLGDLFIVYNHNVRDINDRFRFDSNQFLAKLQYALRR